MKMINNNFREPFKIHGCPPTLVSGIAHVYRDWSANRFNEMLWVIEPRSEVLIQAPSQSHLLSLPSSNLNCDINAPLE